MEGFTSLLMLTLMPMELELDVNRSAAFLG
jgi:hypothetical protein